MMPSDRVIALIPARGGSKRVPGKNVRELAGHPLLCYAIWTAQESELCDWIVVSTDDPYAGEIAMHEGAQVVMRPRIYATDYSPDIDWVNHVMDGQVAEHPADIFIILRPTSPFRRGAWVQAAYRAFCDHPRCDSLRAMRPVTEHPGKMWRPAGNVVYPLLPFSGGMAPWHSTPSQELPRVYVQTAALEIARTSVLPMTISGSIVLPWIAEQGAPESIDINSEDDWTRAEAVARVFPQYLPRPRHEQRS